MFKFNDIIFNRLWGGETSDSSLGSSSEYESSQTTETTSSSINQTSEVISSSEESSSSIYVKPSLETCTISLMDYDESNTPCAIQGAELTLPTAIVKDSDNNYRTNEVDIIRTDLTDENASINGLGILTSDVIGDHTIKYTVIDKEDTSKIYAEKEIKIHIYLKVTRTALSANVGVIDNELTDNPSLRITDHGIFCTSFNFEPSKNYYAEFEMAKFDSFVNNQLVTFSHNIAENGAPTEGAYYEGFKLNDADWECATSKYVTGWNLHSYRMWYGADMIRNRYRNPGVDLLNKLTKVAIARVGSNFYYFYNDVLINVSQYEELENKDTLPGILAYAADGSNVINTSFSNFNFIKDEEAVKTKVNSLTTELFDYYLGWDNSTSVGSAEFNGNSFKFKNEDTFVNSDVYNSHMVTPLVNLCGTSWQVDYDVKVDAIGDNNNWGALLMDIRTVHDRKCVVCINNTFNSTKLSGLTNNDVYGTPTPEKGTNLLTQITEDLTREMTLHYTIKLASTITDSTGTTEHYEITISEKGNENHSYTLTQDILYSNFYYASSKNLVFKAAKFAGTISNFEYK